VVRSLWLIHLKTAVSIPFYLYSNEGGKDNVEYQANSGSQKKSLTTILGEEESV
jgi:hypothetical protein